MFRRHFQPSAHVAHYQLACVFGRTAVGSRILALVQQQVVTHTASDEAFLDARQCVYGVVDVEQRTVVRVQVRTDFRMDTRRTSAFAAKRLVLPSHAVHIGRRPSQIAQITLEVGHPGDGLYLFQDAFLAPADDEFSLMGRNGAERAASETSAVYVDREFDHVVGRNPFSLVFRMRQTCIRQVERAVQLFLCHRRIRRVHHHHPVSCMLQDTCSGIAVGFFFDMAEVLGLLPLVLQAFFV